MTDASRLTAALESRYRIVQELGQGGMATVYLAEDLKHGRKVAVKVLRPELAAVLGADRFLQEIKTTANLQHPHILPLFDSGEVDGFLYYVMPYVEGVTLRQKLDRETQLGIDEAVKIATEVADALDYAHRHGVIHRDIKPENILLHDGRPVVADFGIALAVSAAAGGRMTETGMSLGTPHYMSPEQATADKEITGRADIYSLAAVLYEMLTGEPPHIGNSAQAIIMKIVTEDAAPVTRLRKSVPPHIAAALATALERLPADRFDSATTFAGALADPSFTVQGGAAASLAVADSGAREWRRRFFIAAGAGGLLVVAAVALLLRGQGDPGSVAATDVVNASLALGDSIVVRAVSTIRLAIDPAGRRVAFVGPGDPNTQLWVRDLGEPDARPLPDTRGAFAPFFSPDGESIGFFTAAGGQTAIKVIAVTGGVARTVVQDSVASFGGGSWGDDGGIYFTNATRGLGRVASSGGAVTRISIPDTVAGTPNREHDFPDVLPGSRRALVMLWRGSIGSNHIGVVDLTTGAVTDVAEGTYARYVAPGFVAIGTADGQVRVAGFDPRSGRILGTPVPLLQRVQRETSNGTVQFAASATGTIVYLQDRGNRDGLVWVDRRGQRTPVDSTMTGVFPGLALSPDGTQIAVTQAGSGESQVWVKQLATGAFSRLSFDITGADRPVWSVDGSRVAFMGQRDDLRTAWARRADGSDSLRAVVPGHTRLDEIAFDPLGRFTLLRSEGTGAGSRKLLVVENGTDTVPRVLIQSRFDHYAMALSPDGHWLAYVSVESGMPEVYVRPFPHVDSARFAISVGGGTEPLWRRDGTELFFRTPRGEMFAVPVTTGPRFAHGPPVLLFRSLELSQDEFHRAYDIHPDGKRFLMIAAGGGDVSSLNVILNWRAELEAIKRAE